MQIKNKCTGEPEVRRNIRKMARRARYLQEQEYHKCVIHVSDITIYEDEESRIDRIISKKADMDALKKSLEDLLELSPDSYEMIFDCYLSDMKQSLTALAKPQKISRQAYSRRLKKALGILKTLVTYHLEND